MHMTELAVAQHGQGKRRYNVAMADSWAGNAKDCERSMTMIVGKRGAGRM
jgi:hypothetical protein